MLCELLKEKFEYCVGLFVTEQPQPEEPQFTFETFGIDDDVWSIAYGTPDNHIKVTHWAYTIEVIDGKHTVGTSLNTEDNVRIKKEMLEALGKSKKAVPLKFEFLYDYMQPDPVIQKILQIA